MTRRQYCVILPNPWMNENGYGVNYTRGPLGESQTDALTEGFRSDRLDDFNVGVVEDGRLVDLLWMGDSLMEAPEVLARISREIGLR